MSKWNDLGLSYEEAAHAMQSAVAYEMNKRSAPTEPKHLRVGVNVAMCDHAALVFLLVEKGVITEEEYLEAIRQSMNNEVHRYEQALDPTGRVKFR